jgi:hypothetical protein
MRLAWSRHLPEENEWTEGKAKYTKGIKRGYESVSNDGAYGRR